MFRIIEIERLGISFAGILRKEDILPELFLESNNNDKLLLILKQNGIQPLMLCRVKQEHKDNIYIIDKDKQEHTKKVIADGIITKIPGIALCISIADCVPVFLFDSNKKILGIMHAGREGTRKKIVQKALEKFVCEFKTSVEDVTSFIGPSIGPCCYRLSDDLLNACSKEGLIITGNKTLDLWKSNKKQLLEYGVKKQNIFISGECTCCDNRYYSYRRGDKIPRNYAVAMI